MSSPVPILRHSFSKSSLAPRLLDTSPPPPFATLNTDTDTTDTSPQIPSAEKPKRKERPPTLELARKERDRGERERPRERERERDRDQERDRNRDRDRERTTDNANQRAARHAHRNGNHPPLQTRLTPSNDQPRTASSTSSSLDPYYFSFHSPNSSPTQEVPPLPETSELSYDNGQIYTTQYRPREPVTPGRDPASIDRRGLIGVGELSTPRWGKREPLPRKDWNGKGDSVEEEREEDDSDKLPRDLTVDDNEVIEEDYDDEDRSSPWTIEAVDEDQHMTSEETPPQVAASVAYPPRTVRSKPSVTEESGGEEILYKPPPAHPTQPLPTSRNDDVPPSVPGSSESTDSNVPQLSPSQTVPPSSFHSHHKAKKRTSDEFAMDQSGSLVSKLTGASLSGLERDKEKEEKMARKHRSLGVGIPNSSKERVRDRRRGESIAVSLSGSSATPRASIGSSGALRDRDRDRHSRQSSSSSTHDASHARRTFTDFSHLPPSPSTSTIPSFLRHSTSITSVDATSPNHTSPNVAHSLLRGTQEGWSGLDDSTTAEALRKLDGISGKSVRARSSFGSGGSRGGSRPVTPVSKGAVTSAWEGRESIVVVREKEQPQRDSKVSRASTVGKDSSQPVSTHVENGDGQDYYLVPSGDRAAVPAPQTTPVHQSVRKSMGSAPGSARSSFGQQPLKRGSVSSVSITGTPTTGSRDSTSLSTTTSATSASVVSSLSHRHSLGKLRRNSTSSDVSSVHSTDFSSQRDRAAALATTGSASIDALDDDHPLNTKIPPVPPLPKEYQSPVPSSTGYAFPALSSPNAGVRSSLLGSPTSGPGEQTDDPDRTIMVPFIDIPPSSPPQKRASPVPHRTPQKKWSFSSALSLKLSSSSKDLHSSSSPLSPKLQRSMQTNQNHNQERRVSTTSAILTKNSGDRQDKYQARSQEALHLRPSASSSSLLPIQSSPSSPSPAPYMPSKTPDRHVLSRSDSASSASTRTGTAAPPSEDPGSPLKKSATSKRLTPSAIPFFRRSSSQSMQLPPSNANMSVSPSAPPGIDISYHASSSSVSTTDSNPRIELAPSPSMQAPPSAHKKSSVLSLGLPSLLKGSSSRKSLHVEKPEPKKEKKEKEEKSEGRISVLMGRKRGKTLSSGEHKAPKPLNLPPMQMSALPSATAQRVANLKSDRTSPVSPTNPTVTSLNRTRSSIATSHPPSSPASKASDASLRSTRQNLPTIAGSPSVGTALGTSGTAQPPPSASSRNADLSISLPNKDTPTKIPRMSSRTSATSSPQSALKSPPSLLNNRRASLIGSTHSFTHYTGNSVTEPSPSPQASYIDEFGVLDANETPTQKAQYGAPIPRNAARASPQSLAKRNSIRSSPQSMSRVPRQLPIPPSSNATSTSATAARKSSVRDAVSFGGLRKSIASTSTSAPNDTSSFASRLSALSPSKSIKLLSPKVSLSAARTAAPSSTSPAIQNAIPSTPSSGRHSHSTTPSPVPSSVDEEELLGDEEMMAYIRRQQAKKLASGAKKEELDELLRFPEPLPPLPPSSPSSILKTSQNTFLSDYERKEILDYPAIYCIGARSEKKQAHRDNPTNNYGYDDERGDYLVVNHDHLAYRYEIIDTLGKGSFGQVLHCRDHCTGESVAIKIIRNKKRFHHQALVEIKILENLRKWDQEEKHHVIKMTEHFYFRSHLCIAMELLSINLYELIKANSFNGFTTTLIRRFTSQMLASLSLMRHHRIVHCDLKPENVLLRHPAKSAIKVIDFGSSCFEHEKVYTYIQSRFYRSPEVILGMHYHMAIDMWSLGCILAELYTGYPIFPGENEQEQLACIMEVLGVPDKELINRSSRKKLFFDSTGAPRPVVNSRGRRRRPGSKTLAQVLKCDDEVFVDFIAKCLHWDPERRLKPQTAMRHPFLAQSRRAKLTSPVPTTSRSLLSSASTISSSRVKSSIQETPKKSQIGAPTPLTARLSVRAPTTSVPATPIGTPSLHGTIGSASTSHRTYRTGGQPSSVSYHHSSRHATQTNGFTASTKTSS